MWNRLHKFLAVGEHPILAGFVCWLVAQWLDLMSTEFAMAFIPGAEEANTLLRDPITRKLLLLTAVAVKALALLAIIAPISGCLYWGTGSRKAASVPFYFGAFLAYTVVVSNVVQIVEALLRR